MPRGEASPGVLATACLGRERIVINPELARRACRAPNPSAEASAHRELLALLAHDPRAALQRAVSLAMVLCRADSAGLSVFARNDANEPVFRWEVIAGEYSRYLGRTMPRYFSLCELCLERGSILVEHPARAFSDLERFHVPMVEALFVPLVDADRRPLGALWAIGHTAASRFDAEDARMLEQLANHAALALSLSRDESNFRRLRDENEELVRGMTSQAQIVGELKHRIKNTLALVQAIGNLSMKSDLSTARELFNRRISALARAHDMLTAGFASFMPMSSVIESAIEIHDQDNRRFAVSGPDLTVCPKAATTLSLVLHELGTNAVKYGALSSARGNVSITWTADSGDTPLFTLHWIERGGPPVRAPARRGFGTTVVQSYPRQNCDAATELRFDSSGLEYVLTAPLWRIACNSPPIAPLA